jgi:hypothetical protein
VALDYSDENGAVSGGESEDDDSRREEQRHSHDNEISTTTQIASATARSTEEATSQRTTTPMPACDEDNGCEHECRMVIDDYDTEARIQCSCRSGYKLDEIDGRRCHGKMLVRYLINFPPISASIFLLSGRHQRVRR